MAVKEKVNQGFLKAKYQINLWLIKGIRQWNIIRNESYIMLMIIFLILLLRQYHSSFMLEANALNHSLISSSRRLEKLFGSWIEFWVLALSHTNGLVYIPVDYLILLVCNHS